MRNSLIWIFMGAFPGLSEHSSLAAASAQTEIHVDRAFNVDDAR
jgi:hypothetical protein